MGVSEKRQHFHFGVEYPFNDVLNTFLGLKHGSCIAVYGRVRKLSDFKNILICVPKMNKGLMGLEWHEGE